MNRRYWILAVVFVVTGWLASAVVYPTLPARVPTHWNLEGKVDGYGSPLLAVLPMPFTMMFMIGLFAVLPALSPKSFEVDSFRSTYLWIMVVTLGLFLYIHGVVLYGATSRPFDVGRTLFAGIFLALALIGNVLGRVRRNFYVGIRVPWTLASDRVWNDTHRLAGWVMVGGSLLGFVLTILGLPILLGIAILLASTLIPVIYSFVHYKRLERRGQI
jgi:uncharacterized membrane protein